MSNLLLYFEKTDYQPFEVKDFCCETGYKLDEIYESVKRLIYVKLVVNEGSEENYKLAMNEAFAHGGAISDIVNFEMGNRF